MTPQDRTAELPPETTGDGSRRHDVVILTGMSGAGRSTAARALEDLDWFVVDNLPPGLLLKSIGAGATVSPPASASGSALTRFDIDQEPAVHAEKLLITQRTPPTTARRTATSGPKTAGKTPPPPARESPFPSTTSPIRESTILSLSLLALPTRCRDR